MANNLVSTLPALGALISFTVTLGWWGRSLYLRWTVRSSGNFNYVAPFWFFTVIFSAFTSAMIVYWIVDMIVGESNVEGAWKTFLEYIAVVVYCAALGDYIAVRMRGTTAENAASQGSKPSA